MLYLNYFIMKTKLILPLVAVAVVAVAVAAFVFTGTSKHLTVIPDNPACLMKVDAGNLIDDSDILNNDYVKSMSQLVSGQLPEMYKELFEDVMANPNNSGVNFDEPVVFAMVNEHRFMLTAAMENAGKFKENLDLFAIAGIRTAEIDGITFIETGEDEFCLAFDNDMMILLADSKDVSKMDLMQYFNYEGPRAIDNTNYDAFFNEDDDFAMLFDIDGIMAVAEEMRMMRLDDSMMAVYAEMLKDICVQLDLNFEKGEVAAEFEIIGNNDYLNTLREFWKESSKKHLKYVPADAILVSTAAMNLEGVSKLLAGLDVDALLSAVGLDSSVFKSLSGDYTFAVLPVDLTSKSKTPQFFVAIDCADRKIFDLIISQLGREFTNVDNDVYALHTNKKSNYSYYSGYTTYNDGYDHYLMYKNNTIFVMPENLYSTLKSGDGISAAASNFADNRLAGKISNGMVVDFANLQSALEASDEMPDDMNAIFNLVDYALFNSEEMTKGRLQLNLKNDSENFLKQVVDASVSLIPSF